MTRYKRYNDCQEDIVNMDKKGEIFSIRPSKKLDIDILKILINSEKYMI